ncbi:unnamed protein product, partial [Ectocarpus sp. 4 AP-2014]
PSRYHHRQPATAPLGLIAALQKRRRLVHTPAATTARHTAVSEDHLATQHSHVVLVLPWVGQAGRTSSSSCLSRQRYGCTGHTRRKPSGHRESVDRVPGCRGPPLVEKQPHRNVDRHQAARQQQQPQHGLPLRAAAAAAGLAGGSRPRPLPPASSLGRPGGSGGCGPGGAGVAEEEGDEGRQEGTLGGVHLRRGWEKVLEAHGDGEDKDLRPLHLSISA